MAVDLFGRNVGDMFVGNMSTRLGQPTQTVMDATNPREGRAAADIEDVVLEFSKATQQNFERELDQARRWTDAVVDLKRDLTDRRAANQNRQRGFGGSVLARVSALAEGLKNTFNNQRGVWVHIQSVSRRAQQDISSAIRMSDCCRAASKAAGRPSRKDVTAAAGTARNLKMSANVPVSGSPDSKPITPAPPPPPSKPTAAAASGADGSGPGGLAAQGGFMGKALTGLRIMAGLSTFISNELMKAMDVSPFSEVFSGVLHDSIAFSENLHQIMHQQVGFVSLNRQVEESFRDITSSVEASGVTMGQFQKVWLRNIQRGLMLEGKDAKFRDVAVGRAKAVTTSALNTAQALGMQADQMNEVFMDWHMHLGMSVLDMQQMSRNMTAVARNTGVTGHELERAVGSADKIMKSLKGAGLASAQAGKNVLEISALAQKYGVSEKVGEVLQAMTSRANFFKSDPRTIGMLSRGAGQAGVQGQLQAGSLLSSPQLTKQLFEGIRQDNMSFLKNFEPNFAAAGVDMKNFDITKLSDYMQQLAGVANDMADPRRHDAQAAMGAITQLAEQRGMQVGELEQFFKVVKEMGKTTGDKIAEMEAQLKKGGGTAREQQQMQKQLLEMQTNQSMSAFATVQQTLTRAGATSYESLTEDAKRRLEAALTPDMGKDAAKAFLGNLGKSADELLNNVSERAKQAGLNINDLLKTEGFSGLNDAAAKLQQGGDAGEKAGRVIGQIMQDIAQKERTKEGPVAQIHEILRSWNTRLASWMGELTFSKYFEKGAFWITLLGQCASSLALIWGVVAGLKLAKSALGWMFNGGGAGGGGPGIPSMPMMPIPQGPATPAPFSHPLGNTNFSHPFATPTAGPNIGQGATATSGMWGTGVMPPAVTTPPVRGRGRFARVGSALWTGTKAVGGFANRHKAAIAGTAAGAGIGYYASDGDLGQTALGAVGGGLTGELASRVLSRRGGAGGDVAAAMSGMPGWGGNAVPVYVVGGVGLGGLGAAAGGMATASMAESALTAVNAAQAGAETLEMAKDAGVAAKASKGWLATTKMNPMNWFRGGAAAAETAEGAAKGVGLMSKVTEPLSKVLGPLTKVLGPVASVIGKAAAPLAVLGGGLSGYLSAEEAGFGKKEGAAYGVLTGSAGTESTISSMLGLQKGSVGDMRAGAAGAALHGATVGAGIGAFLGPAGAVIGGAVGAVAGELTELVKHLRQASNQMTEMAKENEVFAAGHQEHVNKTLANVTSIQDPSERLAKVDQLLLSKRELQGGLTRNLEKEQSERASTYSWFGLNAAADGLDKSIDASQKNLAIVNAMIKDLEAERQKLQLNPPIKNAEANQRGAGDRLLAENASALDTTARTMELGQKPGSIFVHDTHVEAALEGVTAYLKGLSDNSANLARSLEQVPRPAVVTGGVGMGLFAGDQGSAANAPDVADRVRAAEATEMMSDRLKAVVKETPDKPKAEQRDLGLFSAEENVREAMTQSVSDVATRLITSSDLNNVITKALETKRDTQRKQIFAEVTRALDYEQTASDAATGAAAAMAKPDRDERGVVSTNLMDYGEQLAGEVTPLAVSRAAVESRLEQQKYGNAASATAVLPSMDAIGDYLMGDHDAKLGQIVSLLTAIRENTGARTVLSNVIGAMSGGLPPTTKPGVKNIASDLTKGFWDLTFGDSSPGEVTTEGRGGSA